MTTPPALLITGHSTDEPAAEAFRAFVRELGRRNPELPVAGFFELASPPLAEALCELAERGVSQVAAVPLILGPSKGDVPAALTRELAQHPGVSCWYGRPLGPHPKLLTVLERRLDEALGTHARTPADRAYTTVLLVGRGSTDPHQNAEVHKAARLLWEGRGFAGVETAFLSLAAPDVPSGLDRCLRLGARRIVVLPYVLLTGTVPERVRMQTEGWASAHPEVEVLSADVVWPAEELVDVVMESYREVVESEGYAHRIPRIAPTGTGPGAVGSWPDHDPDDPDDAAVQVAEHDRPRHLHGTGGHAHAR
ncbi:sirohydrochlorin chelatase [Streptomyces sp. KR80]|uniref:sirohydrochlorin chelatase n=1 Tax=Streptomyces sp. KR80 TaxID=3457426 RepID=UPI003FD01EBE